MKSKKIAFFGLLGALSLVLGFFESVMLPEIPFLPPGAKLGLSNLVTMYASATAGFTGGLYIVFIKTLFALITRGTVAAFMSLCGGLASLAALCIMLKKEGSLFSFFGIGVASAVMHNLGQLAAACIVTGTAELLNYGKYLLVFALVTGSVTGTALLLIMPRLRKIGGLYKINNENNIKEMEKV